MKKTVLACCLAAASYGAQAELTPMSELELHSVTGQSGIDIELDVGVSIGEIVYTDTEVFTDQVIQVDPDGDGIFEDQTIQVGDGHGGSLRISNLTIGGIDDRNTLLGFSTQDNGPNLDSLILKVDVLSDGDLVIDGVPVDSIKPVDLKLTMGPVETLAADGETVGVRLLDSLSMYGGALGLKMTVDGETNDIRFRTQVGFDDIDVDMTSSMGIEVRDAFFAGSQNDNDASFFTDWIADISILMSQENGGVTLDFSKPTKSAQNKFDIGVGALIVGNGPDPVTGQEQNLGSFFINDLDIRGVSIHISGH